jgi:hypothetical protein
LFRQWAEIRKKYPKPKTGWRLYWEGQIDFLLKYPQDQEEILSNSIHNQYQGLFPPKKPSRPVLPAPLRTPPRPIREPSKEEWQRSGDIAKREIEKLRGQFPNKIEEPK